MAFIASTRRRPKPPLPPPEEVAAEEAKGTESKTGDIANKGLSQNARQKKASLEHLEVVDLWGPGISEEDLYEVHFPRDIAAMLQSVKPAADESLSRNEQDIRRCQHYLKEQILLQAEADYLTYAPSTKRNKQAKMAVYHAGVRERVVSYLNQLTREAREAGEPDHPAAVAASRLLAQLDTEGRVGVAFVDKTERAMEHARVSNLVEAAYHYENREGSEIITAKEGPDAKLAREALQEASISGKERDQILRTLAQVKKEMAISQFGEAYDCVYQNGKVKVSDKVGLRAQRAREEIEAHVSPGELAKLKRDSAIRYHRFEQAARKSEEILAMRVHTAFAYHRQGNKGSIVPRPGTEARRARHQLLEYATATQVQKVLHDAEQKRIEKLVHAAYECRSEHGMVSIVPKDGKAAERALEELARATTPTQVLEILMPS